MQNDRELAAALDRAFAVDSQIYRDRGFQRRIGYGQRPALIHVDLANAWTRPGHAFSCEAMDVIIPTVQRLNAAARAKGCPIVYTTTAYTVTDGPNSDMGLWVQKIPLETLAAGSEAVAIDDRIAPEPGELVITKKCASAFHGTSLSSFLTALCVDTVIVTGVTMAGQFGTRWRTRLRRAFARLWSVRLWAIAYRGWFTGTSSISTQSLATWSLPIR